MKRVYKRQQEPELLKKYRYLHPDETWEHFRRGNRKGYRQVKQCILEDQHGLCAYCEISIKLAQHYSEVDDFRVEHFYPKGATEDGGHNYHLDWHNLLGVCHGGSQPDVPDADWRFSTAKSDRSCDVPKGGKEITDRILNPLQLPGSKRLFRYTEHNGRMSQRISAREKGSTSIRSLRIDNNLTPTISIFINLFNSSTHNIHFRMFL